MLGSFPVNSSTPLTNALSYFSVVAARGIFSSAIATGVFGFITTIVFLFCTPDIDTWFSLSAPQPFVLIYSMALGKGGATFMTILAVVGLILVRLTQSHPQNLTNPIP